MKKINLFVAIVAGATSLACSGASDENDLRQLEGKVKLENIHLSAKIAGRLQEIHVQEGQKVKKGDTLLVIEVPELDAKMLQADGALMSAEGQLAMARQGATSHQLVQIQAQINAAEAQLDFANSAYLRMEHLYLDSLIPAQQFDELRAKRTAAQAQVEAAKAKRDEISGASRPEVIQSAQGQVLRASGAKNELLQAIRETIILAPYDMHIESISLNIGELVTPGYTLLTGYKSEAMYFRFTIGESQINSFQLGDSLNITVSGTEQIIPSKLSFVKQLPRYADNTSTAPNREIAESFYELKYIPLQPEDGHNLYNNSTVFISKK